MSNTGNKAVKNAMCEQHLTAISEEVVRATANILGPDSATAKALQDAERRRATGEVVEFFKAGNAIIVSGALTR